MNKDISYEIRDNEIFMIAQFIDVIDGLNKYDKIEDIKLDMKNRKKIYLEYIKNMIDNITDSKNFLSLSLCNKNIDDKLEKAKEIYIEEEKYIAYKIGLIDGLKIKNECI